MSKSSTGGSGGRGSFDGDVIGGVIFHDKKKFWEPGADYHYHHSLSAGENTLEGSLVRRAVSVLAASAGRLDTDDLLGDYVRFMTTPGTHNDTYCGTAHRIFFGNYAAGVPLRKCPGNDGHNVDTIDALVTTIPAVLAACDDKQAHSDAAVMVSLTRKSHPAQRFAASFSALLREVVSGTSLSDALLRHAAAFGRDAASNVRTGVRDRGRKERDPVTACYLDSSIPAMLYIAAKYSGAGDADAFRTALLANANRGGENVAAGALLGALFGAEAGFSALPKDLVTDLVDSREVEAEIEAYLDTIPRLG